MGCFGKSGSVFHCKIRIAHLFACKKKKKGIAEESSCWPLLLQLALDYLHIRDSDFRMGGDALLLLYTLRKKCGPEIHQTVPTVGSSTIALEVVNRTQTSWEPFSDCLHLS